MNLLEETLKRLEEAANKPLPDGESCVVNIDDLMFLIQHSKKMDNALGEVKGWFDKLSDSTRKRL